MSFLGMENMQHLELIGGVVVMGLAGGEAGKLGRLIRTEQVGVNLGRIDLDMD